MIYVLEGTATAEFAGVSRQLVPGQFMGFLPGPENTHCVRNCTDSPVRVLVIASNPAQDQVLYTEL